MTAGDKKRRKKKKKSLKIARHPVHMPENCQSRENLKLHHERNDVLIQYFPSSISIIHNKFLQSFIPIYILFIHPLVNKRKEEI